jgi:hypothetical protein
MHSHNNTPTISSPCKNPPFAVYVVNMRRLLVVVLVCLCCSTAARASITESFTGIHDASNWLNDGDMCSSAYLAALAECNLETIELQRKLVYHEPQRQQEREILNKGIQIGFAVSTLMSIGLAWVAINAIQQRKAAYLKWVKLEARLRAQLIGVHRQAYDFAVKLQAATPHAARGNSKLDQRAGAPPLQLHTPVDTNTVSECFLALVQWLRQCVCNIVHALMLPHTAQHMQAAGNVC